MAQHLRAVASLSENPASILSTYMVITTAELQLQENPIPSSLHRKKSWTWYTYMQALTNKHTHTKIKI